MRDSVIPLALWKSSTPRSLDEALRLKAEHPEAVPIQGGTDVMVTVNFDRAAPRSLPEPERGSGASRLVARERDAPARRGPDLHRGDAGAGRERPCPRSPRRRARSARRRSATAGRSAATSAPPRLPETRCRRCSSSTPSSSSRACAATRRLPLSEFLVGPKKNALAEDELIVAVHVDPSGSRQTFMKVGPRNAMVIAVCSLALVADRERGELRAAYGSAGPVVALVTASLEDADGFADRVAAAASPIDDVRGSAAYRRHALRVLTSRALERCLA